MTNSNQTAWAEGPLEDYCDVKKGFTYSTSDYGDEQTGHPFITLKCIAKNGGFSYEGLKFIKTAVSEQFNLSYGDLLFANTDLTRDGDVVGSAMLLPKLNYLKSPVFSMDLSKVTPKNHQLEKRYLYYLFSTQEVKNHMVRCSAGSTVLHLNVNDAMRLKIRIPPLFEQKKIAEILSAVDEVIENTESEISKLENLKKATLNELLTKGIGHTEFKDSEIGRIPKSWEVVSIDSIVGAMESGVSVNSEDRSASSKEIGILKTSCVSNGEFFPHENKVVLGKDIDRVQTAVTKNTIIVSRMNTPLLVGESGFVDHSIHTLFLPDRLWSLTISDESKYSVKWLSVALSSTQIRDEIRRRATGTSGSMKNISKPNFLGILIPSPSLKEQKIIGDIARVFESRISNKKRRRLTVQRMKAALMQDLLTGKVRVKGN